MNPLRLAVCLSALAVVACALCACDQPTPSGTLPHTPAPSPPPEPDPEPVPQPVEDVGGEDVGMEDVALDVGGDAALDVVEDVPEPGIEFDPEAIPEATFVWPMGVSSGAMTHESVLIWGYTEDGGEWTLRLWRPTEVEGRAVIDFESVVEPDESGYFKVDVGGLEAGTWYLYAFFQGDADLGFGARSEIGEVRTALGPEALEPITIGASTCTNFRHAPYESMMATAGEDIDFFIHVGDMSYNDPAQDLQGYRDLWRQTLEDPGYRAVLPAAGMYMTWDDHEIDNNWNPESFDAQRLAAAKQAYFETLPVERFDGDRIWTSYQWGQTAEIFVLDGRSERRPSTRNGSDPIYISPEQMAWLKDRLINSQAHFKILLNSVPITRMPPLWLSADDRWQGYDAQRQELLDFITDNDVHNIWFLAGDFHTGFVAHVEADGPGRRLWEVAVGPSGNGPNPLAVLMDTGILGRELVFPEPQFLYGSSLMEVMTTLTFDPLQNSVHVRFVDAITFQVLFDQVLSEEDE